MKTADEIYQEMKTEFARKSGYEIADDGDMGVRMLSFAAQAEALYIYGQWVTRQFFPQTAEGEYLDRHGELRDLTRKSASKAKGQLRFAVSLAASEVIEIPAGTVCMNSAGVGFITTADGAIAKGETLCTVEAEAVDAGSTGNAAPKTIIYMTHAPVGVESCTNPAVFTGGRDAESDDEFRVRILESYKTPSNGANAAWYKKTALEYPGVAAAGVVSCPRGAGTVDVYIASETGIPDDALIARVQKIFDSQREICTEVNVLAPAVTSLSINAQVKIEAGYNAASVLDNVKSALYSLFDRKTLGRKLYITEIGECIHHVPGVESYRIITPDFDCIAESNVLLQAGEITVGRWS